MLFARNSTERTAAASNPSIRQWTSTKRVKGNGRGLVQQPHVRGTTTRTGSCRRHSTRACACSDIKRTEALIIAKIDPKRLSKLMLKAFDYCIPAAAEAVPSGPEWSHEIKYDGYRVRLERDDNRVRLITRGGYNWTDRCPWIVDAARKNWVKQFVIDGEAVVLGVDGVADFNALHSRKHDREVRLYAFRYNGTRRRGSAGAAFEHAKDQLGAAAGAPAGWDLCRAL